jgi:hydrogenase maturation protease
MTRTLVIGLGSHHGDDRFGWRVAELLAARGDARYEIRLALTPAELPDHLAEGGYDQLLVCDACRGAGPPGSIHRWRWPDNALALVDCRGTHDLSLAEALSLAERLGRLPQDVVIWAAEAATLRPTAPLSATVADTAEDAASQIHHELTGRCSRA